MTLADVLALARAGATDAAWALLEARAPGSADPAALTLRGRLLKDKAKRHAGTERAALLRRAGEAYAAAAEGTAATYPLINAATLSFLGGAAQRAGELARDTLALLESGKHERETPYWLGATRAEALLLLGQEAEARSALRRAVAAAPGAWEDHAATLRQFRLILTEQSRPSDWLEGLRPPPAVHFAGPIGLDPRDRKLVRALDAAVAAAQPGSATGALAAGFDILAGEALLRAGAQLHIILPSSIDAFVEVSVRPFGAEWLPRFERILAEATIELLQEPNGISGGAVVLAEQMAMGLAAQDARLRDAETILLRLGRGATEQAAAGFRTIEVGAGTPARPIDVPLDAPTRLGAIAGFRAGAQPSGEFTAFDDLAAAAEAALSRFEREGGTAALDYGLFDDEGPVTFDRAEALLAASPQGHAVASRPAALALEAMQAGFRTAIAGEVTSRAGTFDYYALWRHRAGSNDQLG